LLINIGLIQFKIKNGEKNKKNNIIKAFMNNGNKIKKINLKKLKKQILSSQINLKNHGEKINTLIIIKNNNLHNIGIKIKI